MEEDLTVIVGENDSGKSSLIDILKIIFENTSPEDDDFYRDTVEMCIDVDIGKLTLIKKFKKDEVNNPEFYKKFSPTYLKNLKEEINLVLESKIGEDEKKIRLSEFSKELDASYRSNMLIGTIAKNIDKKLNELENNDYLIQVDSIPDYNVYFLDGKKFDDINFFLKQTFFKDKRRKIWSEELETGKTLQNLVSSQLDQYSSELEYQIKDKGIRKKLNNYLPGLTDIRIIPDFEPSDINIGVKVQFLEGDNEVFVNKKGDGTKRRITMALLEYKTGIDEKEDSVYVFDEPDIHLHVKAQEELLEIIRKLNETKKQIIITTHSPFIMNSVKYNQIRVLLLDDGKTKIKPMIDDKNVEWTLNALGIANTHLFFSRKILVVEGHTEEIFIPLVYQKFYNTPLRSNLVKIIRGAGIDDVPRLSKVLEDFVDLNNIFLLIDNDGNKKLRKLIERLNIEETNVFKIGYKEFEDSFKAEIIYSAWLEFVKTEYEDRVNLESFKEKWTKEKIKDLKQNCKETGEKFSEKLIELSRDECDIPMKKTELGRSLAKKVKWNDLADKLQDLFSKLNEG